jgi:hypothetical protein
MERREEAPQPQVKRVTLPSGKSIEVLYFSEADTPLEQAAPPITQAIETRTPLHICEDCGSSLVYPTEWEEAGEHHWHVELRCPNCEWYGGGDFDQDTVEAFDDVLDQGIDVLLTDYRALVNSNMEDEIDRFAQALAADAILPSDF